MTSEPLDLTAVRVVLSRLVIEGRVRGIPNSYIRTIEATQAAVDAIEKARTK